MGKQSKESGGKSRKGGRGGLKIRSFVWINFVSENAAEECKWFSPDADDPFPSGPLFDHFLDADDAIIGVRDEFFAACKRKGAIVVWKQIRSVEWDAVDADELEQLLDQGDHDSYQGFIAVV